MRGVGLEGMMTRGYQRGSWRLWVSVILFLSISSELDAVNNADFTPTDAATDTVEGRFRGPDQDHAQEVLDMIKDAKEHPEGYGRPPNPPPKTKKRRKKKTDEL